MKRHGFVFIAAFAPAAGAVGALVYQQRPLQAVAAGTAGLLLHWALSARNGDDGELADASYFFGFLLTLVFLAVGLYTLGASAQQRDMGANIVVGFLQDLAAGLLLTIVGLVVRQVRTLSASRAAVTDASLTEAQRELAAAMRVLVQALQHRPEEVAARELEDTRGRARAAAESLERNVTIAAERVDAAMAKLEESVTAASGGLLRASSGLSDSLSLTTQRIQIEVGQVLGLIESQRKDLDDSHRRSQTAVIEMQRAHETVDSEYRRGLTNLATAGTAFADMATGVARQVESLPNPAERLVGLWDGVRALETTLSSSITGASQQLDALRKRSEDLSGALGRLGQSADTASGELETGGDKLSTALRRELRQMNEILDEYTQLLEQRVTSYR